MTLNKINIKNLDSLLHLYRPDGKVFKANLFVGHAPKILGFYEENPFLNEKEMARFEKLKVDRRKKSYLLGRYVAKSAASTLLEEKDLAKIGISNGVMFHPILKHPRALNMQISITHSQDLAAAIAYPEEHPIAVDIEQIDNKAKRASRNFISEDEWSLMHPLSLDENSSCTMVWTVKEALSKLLRTGLSTPFSVFHIKKIENHKHYYISWFTNFSQYKVLSFLLDDGFAVSIAYPYKTDLQFDNLSLENAFLGVDKSEI